MTDHYFDDVRCIYEMAEKLGMKLLLEEMAKVFPTPGVYHFPGEKEPRDLPSSHPQC